MASVKDLKGLAPGERVSFTARVLRRWDVGGLRMALVGDESGLMRVELGAADVEEGLSYEFRDAGVRQYDGGWTSVSIAEGGAVDELAEDIATPQDEAYIERTFKILSGVQRKKGRREGRLPPWEHPAKEVRGRRMITVRKADSLYYKDGGWFRSKWHFSFDEYYDTDNMGFGTLRVFNDDVLVEGAIWPMHHHRDVEALTYIPEGSFRHQDSLDNLYTMPAGSVQRMTLGAGALHSEQNGSETEPVRFIQIWVIPRERGLEPSVESRETTVEERTNRLLRVIGPDREGGSLLVHQDAKMFISRLEAGKSVSHEFTPGFGGYLFVIDGAVTVNGEVLDNGDAALIQDEERIEIEARETSELIMMEVRVSD